MADPAKTVDQNILPVQALFNLDNSFNTFIGQNQPFYATVNPLQSGLTITNSTIDSSVIGGITPNAGTFTNIFATTGQLVTTPSGGTDIANKSYVDAVAQGLSFKQPARVATTGNITLSGLQTIDGYTTLAGDRVLVKNQSTAANNGIYLAAAGVWSRSLDANTWAEITSAYLFVQSGTTQGGSSWVNTNQPGGSLGTTAITFVQFSNNATYTAGAGLTLTAYQFSLTPVGTASTYGSASSVPVLTTNAYGQISSVTNTSIAISGTQITSGIIGSAYLSGSYTGITGVGTLTAGVWNGSTIGVPYGGTGATTLTGYVYGNGAASMTASTTIPNTAISGLGTMSTQNANNVSITGGSITGTPISGSTIGGTTITASTQFSGPATGLTGTAASLSIGGNAGTVTNGVYTTGSYSNPAWITSILGSIVSGAVASATAATNIAGGTTGALHYQTGVGATGFLSLGTSGYVLTAGASAPTYVAQSTLSVGSASTATSATTATNLAGGIASQIPYQSGAGSTAFIANGTTGQVLTSNGTSAPSWTTVSASVSVTDDTSTNATRYPLFASATSGSLATLYTSSTKYQYNPSTGMLTTTGITATSGAISGASITVKDNVFTLQNAADTTKQAVFSVAGLNTATTCTYTLPGTSASTQTLAALGVTQTFTNVNTFASNTNTFGSSVLAGTTGLASGATTTGNTKTVNIGTNGVSGSTTNITIGSSFGTTTNLLGILQLAGSAGTSGQVLTSAGASTAPTWTTASGATITDDTTTNAVRYISFTAATSGALSTLYTSSTKLKYNPSTGALTASSIIIAP